MDLKGKKVRLHDMCLRDGMHAKREQISTDQMVAFAKAMDAAGVPMIQVSHGAGLGGNSLQHGFAPHSNEEYWDAVAPVLTNTVMSVLLIPGLGTMDEFYQRAYTLLSSPEARAAFSLDGESQATRDLYGSGYVLSYRRQPAAIGARLMMARRLVAAGVRLVTVRYDGWDNHVNIRGAFTDKAPALDHSIAGLLTDLDDRGMLDETLVMITSEFGRTPRINTSNGRDHWARSYSMILAGGGITRGQVYGASDATASEPAKNPVSLEDFLYTVYHQLGIDANNELLAFGIRPIEIIKGGKLVKGLLA